MIKDFEWVGLEVPFGESRIGIEDVRPIRDFAAFDLLGLAQNSKHMLSDERDITKYGMYFKPYDENEIEAVDRWVTVRLVHNLNPQAWRLVVGIRSFTAADRHSNKLIRYCFETLEDDLMVAKKEVYLIMGKVAIKPSTDGFSEEITTQKKRYERPLETTDCPQILGVLQGTHKRRLICQR